MGTISCPTHILLLLTSAYFAKFSATYISVDSKIAQSYIIMLLIDQCKLKANPSINVPEY